MLLGFYGEDVSLRFRKIKANRRCSFRSVYVEPILFKRYVIKDVWVIQPPAPGPHIWTSTPSSHKSFNKLNLLLFKVQSLWSCAHYFQWFMGYLNHVDLLMSHVHVLKKLLFNVNLSCFVDFIMCPTDKYMFKVHNKKK